MCRISIRIHHQKEATVKMKSQITWVRLAAVYTIAISLALTASVACAQTDVLTYHGDNYRTGWNSSETLLTVANVKPGSFGLLYTVSLDERVDAEPLIVTNQLIQGQVHNVVYVATENNTVYAIDADTGGLPLWHANFGPPFLAANKDTSNVYPWIGILSTPVIDRNAVINGVTGIMYFVTDNAVTSTQDEFRLHAISLSTGSEVTGSPVTIAYSEQLCDGTQWKFNPLYQLQRPALLEVNGSIYVAFGSSADWKPDQSRGTILRYDAATLAPQSRQLTDQLAPGCFTFGPNGPYYLSSIWQSGYGPAADENGDIFFSTGNSDPNEPSYDKTFNHPNSVIRLSGDLSKLIDSFTPYNYFYLDRTDSDLSSGGTLVLPTQSGKIHLAIAGGKDGRAFLVDRDNMGGFNGSGGPDRVVQTIFMGACFCGPAYFIGADGAAHILTGGGPGRNGGGSGGGVTSWKLQTTPAVKLIMETHTGLNPVRGLPDYGGVVPVISSNGTTPDTGIVWFVQKPLISSDNDPGTLVTLRAFSASDLTQQLWFAPAGTWKHADDSNANIVPTVANGKVYVASNKQLQIFGLLHKGDKEAQLPAALVPSTPDRIVCPAGVAPAAAVEDLGAPMHEFYGTICQVSSTEMRLALRSGHAVSIDITEAVAQQRTVVLTPGRTVRVAATIDGNGVAHAQQVSRGPRISPRTPPDR
jgi:hypothetical protein